MIQLSVILAVATLLAPPSFASPAKRQIGMLHVTRSDKSAEPQFSLIEIHTRAIHKLNTPNFTRPMLSLLNEFNGIMVETYSSELRLKELTYRSLWPFPYLMTMASDGLIYFGKIDFENQTPEIVLSTLNGMTRVRLTGPIMHLPNQWLEGDVTMRGWMKEDGSLEVARLKRKNTDGSETVFASGILHSLVPTGRRQREYFVEGPGRVKTWIKKRIDSRTDRMIGTQILVYGHLTVAGRVDPIELREELSDDDHQCAERLMNEILATQKEFQSHWKKQK